MLKVKLCCITRAFLIRLLYNQLKMGERIFQRIVSRAVKEVDRIYTHPPESVGSATVISVVDCDPSSPFVRLSIDHWEQNRKSRGREYLTFKKVPRGLSRRDRVELIFCQERRVARIFNQMGYLYIRKLDQELYGQFPNGFSDVSGLGRTFIYEGTHPRFFAKFIKRMH